MIPTLSEFQSDEAEMLRKSVREWAEKEVYPYRHEIDDNEGLIENAMRKLFLDVGMQKIAIPEAFGGAGYGINEIPPLILHAFEEIGKADVGIGFVLSVTLATTLSSAGSRVFDFLGEKMDDFCIISLIPPQFGRDRVEGLDVVRAREEGDRVALTGKARPLNSGLDAHLFAVICDYNGLSIAFTDEGIERGEKILQTGLIASRNCDVRIKALIDRDRILPAESWIRLRVYLNLCLSSLLVGSAMDSYRIVREWAENRYIRGKPLKDNSVDAEILGEIARETIEAKSIAQVLAKSMMEDRPVEDLLHLSNVAFMKCCTSAFRSADRAMELMASQGYAREGLLEKQWRDAKSLKSIMNVHHLTLELSERYFSSKLW